MREACPRRHTALARAKEKKKRCADGREMIALLEAAEEMQLAQAGPDGVSRAEQAEAERRKGNEAFARGQYQQAIDAYTASLDYVEDARAYANRAACWLRLGHARYVERRVTHGLFHQICDGEAKVVRWVHGTDGSCSSPAGYWPFCNGMCARDKSSEFKCRSVELVTPTVTSPLISPILAYVSANISARSSAAGSHLTFDQVVSFYRRSAKAQVGLRDFPRAVNRLNEGLRSCPESEPLRSLLGKIGALGVKLDDPPMASPFVECAVFEKGEAAMAQGRACVLCAYCTVALPHPKGKARVPSLEPAALHGLGRDPPFSVKRPVKRSKERALAAAGFPSSCPKCACDPCADIDQRAIRRLIDEP